MRWLAAAAALLVLCGCAPAEKKTIRAPGGSATVEKRGERTRVSASGTDEVIEVEPSEVMARLDLPLYPGARVVEGSQYCAVSKKRGDRTYSARLEVKASFEDVRKWYEKRLDSQPISASVMGKRTALVARTDHATRKTRTVLLSSQRDSQETEITLVLVTMGGQID